MKMVRILTVTVLLFTLPSLTSGQSISDELKEVMSPFIGSWKSQANESTGMINYRKFEWGLNDKIVRFFEAPGANKKWRVESVITWNSAEQEIQANDWADWGNYADIKILKKDDGIDRMMTVYNAIDKKVHFWISEWRLLDDDTWQSQAKEVDKEGTVIQVWPKERYERVESIPDSVIER